MQGTRSSYSCGGGQYLRRLGQVNRSARCPGRLFAVNCRARLCAVIRSFSALCLGLVANCCLLLYHALQTELLRVDVETASTLSAGQTVCDIWGQSRLPKNCTVCMVRGGLLGGCTGCSVKPAGWTDGTLSCTCWLGGKGTLWWPCLTGLACPSMNIPPSLLCCRIWMWHSSGTL